MTLAGQKILPTGESVAVLLEDLAVKAQVAATYAPLASPALTGTPTAPPPAGGDNTNQIATTAYVQASIGSLGSGHLPLVGGTMTGPIIEDAGSAALPTYAVGAANIGMFRPAANVLGFSVAGSERARIDSGGLRNNPIAAFITRFGTANHTPWMQSLSTFQTTVGSMLAMFGVNTGGATRYFAKSRNATIGSHQIVANGDNLGNMSWGGSDGAKIIETARISVDVDGTGATDTLSGRMLFYTTPNTALATPVERMRINKDGDIQAGGANTFLSSARHFQLRSYTNATKPSAAVPGQMIFISDVDGGTLAVSDGSVWDVVGGAGVVGDYVAIGGDTMTGPLILNADPVLPLGAATMQWAAPKVDAALTGSPTVNGSPIATTASLGDYLLKAGGTMDGALTLSAVAPTADHAVKRSYVDAADALLMPRTGGTFSGAVSFNENVAFTDEVAVPTPTFAVHAANKNYVDDEVALLAPKVSPAFTGVPTAPTAANETNNTQIATTAFVQAQIGSGAGIFLPLSGGEMDGPIILPDPPTISTHATNKAYVDLRAPLASPALTGSPTINGQAIATQTYVTGAIGGPYVPVTGGGFSGYVTVHAYPLASNQIANKGYVDQERDKCVKLAGSVMTGALTLSSVAPTADHAVKRSWVENLLGTQTQIDTVAAAKLVTAANAPNNFKVAGYTTVGDGGEGIWNKETDIATVLTPLKFSISGLTTPFINRSRKVRPEEAGAIGSGNDAHASANYTAFNALLNSTEHSWIEIPKPGVYKFNTGLVRSIMRKGLVIEMHPEAELDFSSSTSAIVIKMEGVETGETDIQTGTYPATAGQTIIDLASSSGFAVGEMVKLKSLRLFDPLEPPADGTSSGNVGEIGIIDSVSSSLITLFEPIDDSYNSHTPKAVAINQLGRLRIIGGKIRGNSSIVQSGLYLRYAENPIIEGTHFIDFQGGSLIVRDCLGGKADSIDVYGHSVSSTGYGVSIQDCTRGFTVTKSNFRRTRHAVTFSNSYHHDVGDGGVVRDVTVSENYVYGTAEANDDALDTHNNALRIKFLYNHIMDSKGHGVHAECPDVEIIGNTIIRCKSTGACGIVSANGSYLGSYAKISDNYIKDCSNSGILVVTANPSGTNDIGRLIIENNQIYAAGGTGGEGAISSKSTGKHISIKNNYIENYAIAAIEVLSTPNYVDIEGNVSFSPVGNIPAINLYATNAKITNEMHHLGTASTGKYGVYVQSVCDEVIISNSKFMTSGSSALGTAIHIEAGANDVTVQPDNIYLNWAANVVGG